MQNLRQFFSILQEWDAEGREAMGGLSGSRNKGAKTIAEHSQKGVESA